MNKENNLVGVKGYDEVNYILANGSKYNMKYPNEVIIQKSCEKDKDIVIIVSEIKDLDVNIEEFKNGTLELKLQCKRTYDYEEDSFVETYKNMSCKMLTYSYDCEHVTEYIYVFAKENEKVSNIKKEVNEFLKRRNDKYLGENIAYSLKHTKNLLFDYAINTLKDEILELKEELSKFKNK